jgi:hypothetical protein
MCTDSEGINSYFHCLIYYEQFSKFQVLHDDDSELAERLKKKTSGKQGKNANLLRGLFNDIEEPYD